MNTFETPNVICGLTFNAKPGFGNHYRFSKHWQHCSKVRELRIIRFELPPPIATC